MSPNNTTRTRRAKALRPQPNLCCNRRMVGFKIAAAMRAKKNGANRENKGGTMYQAKSETRTINIMRRVRRSKIRFSSSGISGEYDIGIPFCQRSKWVVVDYIIDIKMIITDKQCTVNGIEGQAVIIIK